MLGWCVRTSYFETQAGIAGLPKHGLFLACAVKSYTIFFFYKYFGWFGFFGLNFLKPELNYSVFSFGNP